tara:strand:+ start:12539 stop:13213 length:675 start_codon:yes stop_codon:yes gene_type:complete
MTKREIIYSVFEKLKIQTDDTDITEEFVSSLIDSKRATLIKQQYGSKPWGLPIEVKQELCMDLEVASSIDGLSCFGKILRTKSRLPNSIKIRAKEGPLNIRKYDRTEIPINIVPIERLPFVGHNGFIANMIYAAVDYDGKLYLVSTRKNHLFLENIKVTDVFDHPDDAYELICNTTASSVEAWDQNYPVESSMADILINMIAQELGKTLAMPEDNVNDAEDVRN